MGSNIYKSKGGESNVFYLTYKTTKENEKISLISNKDYGYYDIHGKWIDCKSFYSINKSLILITIDSSINITTNEYTFKSIGEHKVKIKLNGNINNLGGMFYGCNNLIKIEGVISNNI